MERFLGRVVVALCFCMFLATISYGRQQNVVYLKDGGTIACQKFWKENGKVMVLVNRDVLVDLAPYEVDMKRTFTGKAAKTVKKKTKATKKDEIKHD